MRAKQIAEALAATGCPERDAAKNRLSLAPLLFQEATAAAVADDAKASFSAIDA